jgi:regulator of protease activity HflC (stomatin/prohibitin superfamily)
MTGLIIVGVILFVLIIPNIVIVPEAHAYIVEQFGAYRKTLEVGLHVKVPFIQRIAKKVTLKEQVLDYPPQNVITKDNVTMQIDTVVYFQIKEPKLYTYGVDNPMFAMETLTATTLRNVIGELELDETLTSRDNINSRMKEELDIATDPWGIRVTRVELKNIMPPRDIQDAMEKQMRAERERREKILQAEGEKKSSILQAEGEKESAILRADAKKIEMLREAEGHAESIRMHKEAEAEGIIKIQQAEANAIAMLKKAGLTNDDIIRLKSFDALKVASNGKATKVIIPSDIQNLTSLVAGVKESAINNDATV